MPTLSDLLTRLSTQFIDLSSVAVPSAVQTEGLRAALERINQQLSTAYTIQGLDGALETTLPVSYLPALLTGAAAFCLDYTFRSRLTSFPRTDQAMANLPASVSALQTQFQQALSSLRLDSFSTSDQTPYSPLSLPDPLCWESDDAMYPE